MILRRLSGSSATANELAAELGHHPSLVRNVLWTLYVSKQVGCDSRGRYHRTGQSTGNGVPVVFFDAKAGRS
jgi:DNA-binding IclR family transcriptional regulator